MENKTHWKKFQDNNYVGEFMFEGTDKDLVVTIKDTFVEEVYEPNSNTKSNERVISFVEIPQKLICNTTNAKRIEKLLGSPFVEDWVGKKIALYFDKTVKFGGQTVGGIRVRTTLPADHPVIVCEMCGNELKPTSGKSVEWLANYTKNKYGAVLCGACAVKQANNQANNQGN